MPETWKHICDAGDVITYIDPATQQPKQLVADEATVKHWHDSGKAMLADGLSIPIPLEHQSKIGAMTADERKAADLKNNAGFVGDFKLFPSDKGSRFFAKCDIADPALAAKLPTTIKFTSPWINSFTDGLGKRREGVISHLALTSRPRIVRQEPFPSIAAALSLCDASPATFDPKAIPEGGIDLSRAGLVVKEGTAFKPKYPIAFSLWTGAKLAEEEMPPAMKPKKKPVEDKEAETVAEEAPAEAPTEAPTEAPGPMEEMGNFDILCDLLSVMGVELPEDCTEDAVKDVIVRAFIQDKAGKMHEKEKPTPGQNPQQRGGGQAPTQMEAPPMYMSLEVIEKIADPTMKAIAKQNYSLTKRELDRARADRDTRVKRIAGTLLPAKRDAFLSLCGSTGAQLSLDGNGVVQDPLAEMLNVLDGGIPDIPEMLKGPNGELSVEAHPEDATTLAERAKSGKIPEEDAQKIAERRAERSGWKRPATTK